MPLDTRIALGVQPLQLADPLAREGQVQNILASQAQQRAAGMQQQSAQMQMDQAQRQLQQDEDYVRQMTDAIGKNGGPTDMEKAARLMATNRNPQVSQQGVTMLQSLQRLAEAKKEGIYGAPAPVIQNAGPTPGSMGSGTFGMDQNVPMFNQRNVPPLNLTTPAAAPVVNQLTPFAAAPVNQLAAAPQADAAKILLAEYTKLSKFTDLPGVTDRMNFIKEQLKEANKLYTVGGNLVTGTGKPVFTAPPTETELQKNFTYAKTPAGGNYKGSFADFKAISTPKTSVSYGPQEKAEKIEYGKLLIDDFKNIKAQATVATKSLPAIESNLAILDKGFDTGFGTETIAAGARVLGALGVQDAKNFATDAQTFLASANAAVLQRQLEQKGPQTESDAQRITATGAQLGNTKEANKFVLNVAKAQLQRDLEQRNFYAAWREKNKTFEGAEDAWYTGAGGKSLFESPVLKKYAAAPPPSGANLIPGSTPVAPQGAIDALKAGKGTDAEFDAIFGAGAAKRARGGK